MRMRKVKIYALLRQMAICGAIHDQICSLGVGTISGASAVRYVISRDFVAQIELGVEIANIGVE